MKPNEREARSPGTHNKVRRLDVLAENEPEQDFADIFHESARTGMDGRMKNAFLVATASVMSLAAMTWAMTGEREASKEVIAFTPERVRWFTPPYYKDGRQRARLFGDSSQGGSWVDRVKIPGGGRVLAHTHPHDELVTVIEGTWYLGEGERFDPARLKGYPAGSFIVIPAGLPHFVAAKESAVIVQLSGTGKFGTDYVEK